MLCRIGFIEHSTVREIMAKKSKLSGKAASKASGEEETLESATELKMPTPGGGIIDFYYLFGGLGILLSIMMIIYLLLHYVFNSL
jgi:hypothetical protein